MTKRNDEHAPSTFDPAAYSYQGIVDLKPPMPPLAADECALAYYEAAFKQYQEDRKALDARVKAGGFSGNFVAKRTCDHCGAWFQYGAEFKHDNGEVIVVGNICADNAFGYDSRRAYDLDRATKLVKGRKIRMKKLAAAAAFIEAHNLGAVFSKAVREHDSKGGRIVDDMHDRLIEWGTLSEKQVAFAGKLATEILNPEPPKGCDFCGGEHSVFGCPVAYAAPYTDDRIEFTGRVLFTKMYESDDYGTRFVMTVLSEEGWTATSTIPAALLRDVDFEHRKFKGATLSIKARVEHYRNQKGEARVKLVRPSAKVVDAATFTASPKTLPSPTDAEITEALKVARG